MSPLLAVEGLELHFGTVRALAGVTFTVGTHERVALVGPNGAGKTSVLNCVSGVERPSAGRILYRGRDLVPVPPSARAGLGIARTLQALGIVGQLDVLGNLLLGRHPLMRFGAREREHRARCRDAAAELGLDPSTPASALAPGQRKRLELGRVLAGDADLALLDEPFAGAEAADVEIMVAALERRRMAAVLVDHDLDTVLSLTDRVVTLEAGRVVEAQPAAP